MFASDKAEKWGPQVQSIGTAEILAPGCAPSPLGWAGFNPLIARWERCLRVGPWWRAQIV